MNPAEILLPVYQEDRQHLVTIASLKAFSSAQGHYDRSGALPSNNVSAPCWLYVLCSQVASNAARIQFYPVQKERRKKQRKKKQMTR